MTCFWHKWGKWEKTEEGDITAKSPLRLDAPRRTIGRYIYQERSCEKCGKVELNKQEIARDV